MIFAPHVVYDTCLMTALAGLASYMASRAHIARKGSLKDSKRYIGTTQSCTKETIVHSALHLSRGYILEITASIYQHPSTADSCQENTVFGASKSKTTGRMAHLERKQIVNTPRKCLIDETRSQRSPTALLPPYMPKFVRCTATPHWYRCVYDMPKLLILLLRKLRSGEIRHFCATSFVSISLAKE
jgi:hypothetical protein